MKGIWWKLLSIILLVYAVIAGFTVEVPDTNIGQTMRNVFYHVGMWFAMLAILTRSFIASIKTLNKSKLEDDIDAEQSARVGIMFGILGIVTGMIWATFTWGKPWANDPHLNGAAVSLMIYFAYFILRSSIDDEHKKARISAVYNIFAFVLLVVLVGVMPRLSENTLHPGSKDGNPAFGDMDSTMRYVFYPALVGWMLLSLWIGQIKVTLSKLEFFNENKDLI